MSLESDQSVAPRTFMLRLRPSAIVFVMIALTAITLAPSFLTLESYWRTINDYRHGYLIAIVALVWLWLRRGTLDAIGIHPAPRMLLLLVPSALLWLIAWRANNTLAYQLLMPVVIVQVVYCCAGRVAALAIAGPVAYLLFATPIWEQALPLLQRMTVVAAQTSMGMMHVPVIVTGTEVTIPEGTFTILDGCSGKRYFMVTLAVAALAGVVNGLKWRRQVTLLAIAGVLAILANWIRVFVVIYLGHATQMRHHFVAVEHRSLGNAIFVVLLAAVYAIAWRLARDGEPQSAGASRTTASRPDSVSRTQLEPNAMLPSLVLIAMGGLIFISEHHRAVLAPRLGQQPLSVGLWQGPLPENRSWQPVYKGASDSRRVAYASKTNGAQVEVYLNVYGPQRQGSELIYFENTLYAPGNWHPQAATTALEAIKAGLGVASKSIAESPEGERWAMKQVYVVGGWQTGSKTLAQLFYGVRALFAPVASGTLAIAARCAADCGQAHAELENFWTAMESTLVESIPKNLGM